jgi:hypothetical protein
MLPPEEFLGMPQRRENLAGAREGREISPLRRPTRSRTNEGKRRRPAPVEMTGVFSSACFLNLFPCQTPCMAM